MNYLAHLYLSNNNPNLMVGNFIADHVKGSAIESFSPEIIDGIKLHRMIDDFTDHHPVVELSKARLRPHFRKYATVIVDVFYDHYLAKNWSTYHHQSLMNFADDAYKLLNDHEPILPERTKYMLSYMVPQNWLYNYREVEGIERALKGLSRRTKFESGMENSPQYLVEHYADFEREFAQFFAELRLFVSTVTAR
jgi:acyl carrier protein phosphodiesterase